jgi:hypothetical protein
MLINEMSLEEVTLELKRARFWVEDSTIRNSLDLISRMETQKLKLINNKLG